MIITWGPDCQFMFFSWHTVNTGPFILGLALVFIYSFLSVSFYNLKSFLKNRFSKEEKKTGKYKVFDALMFALDLVLKYSIMVLMMTMNGWVNIVLALGMMSGYAVFLMNKQCEK